MTEVLCRRYGRISGWSMLLYKGCTAADTYKALMQRHCKRGYQESWVMLQWSKNVHHPGLCVLAARKLWRTPYGSAMDLHCSVCSCICTASVQLWSITHSTMARIQNFSHFLNFFKSGDLFSFKISALLILSLVGRHGKVWSESGPGPVLNIRPGPTSPDWSV